METGVLEVEKNPGEDEFQQELNRWFESRGIISNLRSHLRHLMIMALQNSQVGLKSTDKSSPKAQAVSLMVAEYLFMHRCHYTLSVFTSEVSNLVNFHPDVAFDCGKSAKKRPKKKYFQGPFSNLLQQPLEMPMDGKIGETSDFIYKIRRQQRTRRNNPRKSDDDSSSDAVKTSIQRKRKIKWRKNAGRISKLQKKEETKRSLPGFHSSKESQVEEIFNALGMSSHEEELTNLKSRYLEEINDCSLIELFLQTLVKMSSKLVVLQNLKSFSHEVNGERLLSEEWSSRIVDIFMGEKMASSQIAVLEEAIFRITENEMRNIIENERKLQIRLLAEREKRIQEYLKKYKDEILLRLIEAEKNLMTRKDIINEELASREKHLTKMVMEWRNKHEEILNLSKDFRNIESENKALQKKLKALEEENVNLKTQRKTQSKTIDDLQAELSALKSKLKEATDANAALKEKIQVLIDKDDKEVFIRHDNANQKTTAVRSNEMVCSEKMISDSDIDPSRLNKESEPKSRCKELIEKDPTTLHLGQLNFTELSRTHLSSSIAEPNERVYSEDQNVSLSSSSEEIILSVRKRLQNLEEETDRINRSYLDYKLKFRSVESDSESSGSLSPIIQDEITTRDTKFCQTNKEGPFIKIKKPVQLEKKKTDVFGFVAKKPEEASPTKPLMRTPTKRQLRHRDFFLKNRQLLQALQKQSLKDFRADLSDVEPHTSSSGEDFTEGCEIYNKELSQKSMSTSPLRSVSVHSNKALEIENEPSAESVKKIFVERSNTAIKKGIDCLALLEQARIKSPLISGRVRSSESVNEEIEKGKGGDKEIETCPESIVVTPKSSSEEGLVKERNDGDDDL